MLKLAISNIAWNKEDDNEIFNYMNELKYNGLEIAPTKIVEIDPYDNPEKALLYLKKLKDSNIIISSMQSILFGRNEKMFESDACYNSIIAYLKKAIDFANIIQCGNLVFGSPKNRNLYNDSDDYQKAITAFRTLGEYAKLKHTVLAIEPNPIIYNTNFINTTAEAIDLVRKVNSEGFKINLDYGTILQNNEDINILKNNMDIINHVHISEPYLELLKKRDSHKDLLKLLVQFGYDKYVSIEMKNQEKKDEIYWAMKYVYDLYCEVEDEYRNS